MTEPDQRAQDVAEVRAALGLPGRWPSIYALADLIAAAREQGRREGAEQALRDAAQYFENGHVMDEPHSFRAANALIVRADDIARDDQ